MPSPALTHRRRYMSKSGIHKFLAENLIITTIVVLAAVDTLLILFFELEKNMAIITNLIIIFAITFFHFDDKIEKLEGKYGTLSEKLSKLNKRGVTQFGTLILVILVLLLIVNLYLPTTIQNVVPPNITSNLTNLTAAIP